MAALLRCSFPAQRGLGWRLLSEAVGEFGEGDADTIVERQVDGEFVVAAAQVLHEGVPGRDRTRRVLIVFSPRIGRSRALSRPWSASTRLLAYCSRTCRAAGTSSSSTRG